MKFTLTTYIYDYFLIYMPPLLCQNLFEESEGSEDEGEPESRHEKAEERLKKRIQRLEEMAIGDKPWQMTGEVAAPIRQVYY